MNAFNKNEIRFRRNLELLAVLLALNFGGAPLFAVVPDLGNNPYRSISDRNVFGLQDPPAIVVQPEEPPVSASNVKLTGITKVLGQTRILMLVQEMGPKGPLPDSKEESYMLSVGQAQGPIEVLEMIDEKEGKVRIKNAGKTMVISFDTHGTKLAAAPAATAAAIPAPPTSGRVSSQRVPGVRNARGGVNLNANPTSQVQVNPGQIPSRPIRTQVSQEEVDVHVATQYLLMETHNAVNADDIAAGVLPPMPPTPLSEGESGPEGQLLPPAPVPPSPR